MNLEMTIWKLSKVQIWYFAMIGVLTMSSCRTTTNKEKWTVAQYFDSIRNNEEKLYAFFQEMPKGGDLHHHAVGAVYAETLLDFALEDDMWISPMTYQLYEDSTGADSSWKVGNLLQAHPNERDSILDYWSVRNYKKYERDGHDWFFASFFKFFPAFVGHESEGLSKLCERASEDNISYLETMITVPKVEGDVAAICSKLNIQDDCPWDLDSLYSFYKQNEIDQCIKENVDSMNSFYTRTDRHGVEMRFQTYGIRVIPNAALVFGHLIVAFETASRSPYVVGVNFLAPEDNEVALHFFDEHMDMFGYLHEKYPDVSISLHSGELVIGKGSAALPDLTHHIHDAVIDAGAKRIGHGVDVAREDGYESFLKQMAERGVSVEINLESNEVILERDKTNHPIHLYRKYEVPFTISTDDEGVLRTDLTNQYVKLIQYCPDMSYDEVKEIVRNSIRYSFLDQETQKRLSEDLNKRFMVFETRLEQNDFAIAGK